MTSKELNFIKNYNEEIKNILNKYSNFQKLDNTEKRNITEEIKNIKLLTKKDLIKNNSSIEFYKIMELLYQLKNELYYKNLSEFIGYINGIYKTSLICGAGKNAY